MKTPDDVENLARLPSLAVVPDFGEEASVGRRGVFFKAASTNGHAKRIELVAQHLPKSQMSEAFRALRTALLLSQPDHPPQVILVTSALPREGKQRPRRTSRLPWRSWATKRSWWTRTCASRVLDGC